MSSSVISHIQMINWVVYYTLSHCRVAIGLSTVVPQRTKIISVKEGQHFINSIKFTLHSRIIWWVFCNNLNNFSRKSFILSMLHGHTGACEIKTFCTDCCMQYLTNGGHLNELLHNSVYHFIWKMGRNGALNDTDKSKIVQGLLKKQWILKIAKISSQQSPKCEKAANNLALSRENGE